MGSPCRLRGQLDEGTEKGGVIISMVKDMVYLDEAEIRREATGMRLGLCGAIVGRGSAGTRKKDGTAAEIAAFVCSSWT